MNERKWTTSDGRQVHIRDMGNGHLVNTIKMLQRNPNLVVVSYAAQCGGFEPDSGEVSVAMDLYGDLVAEADRRGLLPSAGWDEKCDQESGIGTDYGWNGRD